VKGNETTREIHCILSITLISKKNQKPKQNQRYPPDPYKMQENLLSNLLITDGQEVAGPGIPSKHADH